MIFITGAKGFIGSNLLNTLTTLGYATMGIEKDTKYFFLQYLHSEKYLKDNWKFPVVVHLGACTDTLETSIEPFKEDYLYSMNLWQACVERKIKFIYASSAAVYGHGEKGVDETKSPSEYSPLNEYGLYKRFFDAYAEESATNPPSWAGLRFFNVYGPGEAHKGKMASMAYKLYYEIKNTGCATLFASNYPGIPNGCQRRDFIYVHDVLRVIIHFMEMQEHFNGIYNVGTGDSRSFLALTDAIFRHFNTAPKAKFIDMPENVKNKYQNETEADITRLKEVGYEEPFLTLEQGVEEYCKYLDGLPA